MNVRFGIAAVLIACAAFALPAVAGAQDAKPAAPIVAAQSDEAAVRALGVTFLNAVADGNYEAAAACCDASMLDDLREAIAEMKSTPEAAEFFREMMVAEMKTTKLQIAGDKAWIIEDDGDKELFAKKREGKWKLCDD